MSRKEFILQLIRSKHTVSVEELYTILKVSHITIRRDLRQLEEEGLLSRIHGGATLPFGDNSDGRHTEIKEQKYIQQKKRIARKINEIINDNSTIFVNGGSTTTCCLEEIKANNLDIFTNNAVAMSTVLPSTMRVHYLGGRLDPVSKVFYGDVSLQMIENIRVDYCILGANGITIQEGASSYFYNEVLINSTMVKNTIGKVIFVIDSSKPNITSNYTFCPIEDIDIIVTSIESPQKFCEQIKNMGIKIFQV